MKKSIALILCLYMIILSFELIPFSIGNANDKGQHRKLSSLDANELAQLLDESGIVCPKEIDGKIDVVELISRIEEEPCICLDMNYSIVSDYIEKIRSFVFDYDQIDSCNLNSQASSSLVYSSIFRYDAQMQYYNCYAYALGYTNQVYTPGQFSGQIYDGDLSVLYLAALVKDDLQIGFNKQCVAIETLRPSEVGNWENVIAVRKDTTYDHSNAGVGINDFHFAKLMLQGWLHKPGKSAILRFNNPPSNSEIWTDEGFNGTQITGAHITYDSDVLFMKYKNSHGTIDYVYTGVQYHSGKKHFFEFEHRCEDCGKVLSSVVEIRACSGPPCQIFMMTDDIKIN